MTRTTTDYPWLTFHLDLKRAPHTIWMLLGEAVSKCVHIAQTPLKPVTAGAIHSLFMAKGVQGTIAIEGNTLSEEEVKRAVDNAPMPAAPSKEHLRQEAQNIIDLCNQIGAELPEVQPISVERLCQFNAAILKDLSLEEDVVPGELRMHRVGVGKYLAPAPQHCEELLRRMCAWLGSPLLPREAHHGRATDALIRALVAHLYIAWIHPFGDGNGRTARMIEFQILLDAGLPTPVAHLLSNHYNKTRTEYYQQLERARHTREGLYGFMEYALAGFVDGQVEALKWIWGQQIRTVWESFLYQTLRSIGGKPGARIRSLAFDMPMTTESMTPEQISEISPKVAKNYARLSDRTLRRDLDELVGHSVLVKDEGAYQTNWPLVLRWCPKASMDELELFKMAPE